MRPVLRCISTLVIAMIFSSGKKSNRILIGWILAAGGQTCVWAGLGQMPSSIEHERANTHARHTQIAGSGYTRHVLRTSDGSSIVQYVGTDGKVFAVAWNAMHKPDMRSLLGESYSAFSVAAQEAGRGQGIQHSFRHASGDLVVQSAGHLHVFTGVAYYQSKLPSGFDLARMGRE